MTSKKLKEKFDKSYIREVALEREIPIVDLILKFQNQISKKYHENITLLGVCPNSISVVKSAFRSAKKFNAPIYFAATMNQIDLDGGYTTWTQKDFVKIVKEEAEKIDFRGPTIIALDHGGPWLKDKHTMANLSLIETMYELKKSLLACLEAGYDLLHIDTTLDRTLPKGTNIKIETVIKRTLDLIEYVETARKERNLPKISYEVGSEEVHGGLADIKTFRQFMKGLKEGLSIKGLSNVWPCFIVGKVGTDLHTTEFDPITAKTLVNITQEYRSYIKGHYTDYVSNPQDYPKVGMGGANVGPEFSQTEFRSLERLIKIEKSLENECKIAEISNLKRILTKCIWDSKRWKKWLLNSEMGKEFFQLSNDRQKWLLQTCSRYIWTNKAVVEARSKLYENLKRNQINAEEILLQDIDKVMDKYFNSFNLKDASLKIERELKN